jgi:hypothetical protein
MTASLDKLIRVPYVCVGYPTGNITRAPPKDELVSTHVELQNDVGMLAYTPRFVPGSIIFQCSVIGTEPTRPFGTGWQLADALTPYMRGIENEKHEYQCETPNKCVGPGYISSNHFVPLEFVKTSNF